MAANRESKPSELFWRIVISAVGVALILMAVGNVMLFFSGENSMAKVSTRRYGGADDNRPASQRYEWAIDYTFKDSDGITHSGHTKRRGSDMSVKVENEVYYFPFAPYINSLKSEAEPNIGQPLYMGIGILLLFVMNRKKKKISGKFKVATTPNGETDIPELNDYDDSVEEVFQEKDRE